MSALVSRCSAFFLIALALASCGKSKPPAPPAEHPTPAVLDSPTPAPTATPVPRIAKVTPAQKAAVLRLRIASGALPTQETIAALIHRDALNDESLGNGLNRIAIALLTGWTETQLRSPTTRFFVFRNESNASGEPVTLAFPAELVRFDAATGLGLLAFSDTFDYAEDVGFAPSPSHSAPELLLKTILSAGQAEAPQTNRQPELGQPYSVEAGIFLPGPPASFVFPNPGDHAGETTFLALGKNGGLIGFLRQDANPLAPLPLKNFPLSSEVTPLVPDEITFKRFDDTRFEAVFKISSAKKKITLLQQELPRDDKDPLKRFASDGPYPPISEDRANLMQGQETFSTYLPEPRHDNVARWLMQLAAPLHSGTGAPLIYGKPFLIEARQIPGGLFATSSGLPKALPAAADSNPEETGRQFPLEASAKSVHMVAGGRGALVELSGDPYWKLFWFEKMDWLPLPGDLSAASLTGNLDNLFIYDRKTQMVSRYSLPDLTLLHSQKQSEHGDAAIFAGSNSATSPLYFVSKTHFQASDPATLEERLVPQPSIPLKNYFNDKEPTSSIAITGDGQSLQIIGNFSEYQGMPGIVELKNRDGALVVPGQEVNSTPLEPPLPDRPRYHFSEASENAPLFFRIANSEQTTIPPAPPTIRLFSYFDRHPFAEVRAPELSGFQHNSTGSPKYRWIFFDPHSTRLATLDLDRKTWTVRDLQLDEKREQPALLNWPDTSVPDGKDFSFKPILVGGKTFSAEIAGQKDAAKTDPATGILSFPMENRSVFNSRLLNLRVPGEQKAEIVYPILLRTAGDITPLAAPPFRNFSEIDQPRNAPVQAPLAADLKPLKSALHSFPDAIKEIPGITGGYAILLTEARRVDFFSVAERKIAGSFACGENVRIIPATNAVYEYDVDTRTLTRITVPDGKRGHSLVFPANIEVEGLGVGTEGKSPLTLVVSIGTSSAPSTFSDFTVAPGTLRNAVLVLDSETFLGAKMVQPIGFWDLIGKKDPSIYRYGTSVGSAAAGPAHLPSSRAGYIVTLPEQVLALGNGYGVLYPVPREDGLLSLGNSPNSLAGGSITGFIAFSERGQPFGNGRALRSLVNNNLGPSPCGRYFLEGASDGEIVDVCPALGGEKVLRLGRLAFIREQLAQRRPGRFVFLLGDNGPLAILSESGRSLQIVDLDIPAMAAALLPHKFHVTSIPPPVVMEGQTMQYQIAVNNPAAVRNYKILAAADDGSSGNPLNAMLSSTGNLSFRAPNQITAPTRLRFHIEIEGKNGDSLTHEFTCYVLPRQRAMTRKKPGEI